MATFSLARVVSTEAMFNLPALLLLAYVMYVRMSYSRAARLPFTDMPLRQAGASCRARADDHFESAMTAALFIVMGCGFTGLFYSLPVARTLREVERPVLLGLVTATLIGAIWIGGHLKRSWRHRLGADGEQVVGRELDRLIGEGYQVFHDVPFPRHNVDHVVVGPAGVFVVETKTYRKAKRLKKNERSEVVLAEDRLLWLGTRPDRRPIQQAKLNAEELGRWLERESGERVRVAPAVALPGWYVRIESYGEVGVYSASGMSALLTKRGRESLTPLQIDRISRPLARICASPL